MGRVVVCSSLVSNAVECVPPDKIDAVLPCEPKVYKMVEEVSAEEFGRNTVVDSASGQSGVSVGSANRVEEISDRSLGGEASEKSQLPQTRLTETVVEYLLASNTVAAAEGLSNTALLVLGGVLAAVRAVAAFAVGSESDGGSSGSSSSLVSAGLAPVVPTVNDPLASSITQSGTITQGQILTARSNLADADVLGLITYQLQRGRVVL